jgi:transcriptional regulator with XRE-family HTH domain
VLPLEFRIRLQNLRERRRISRIVLSELCGLSSDAIRRYERGESEPSLHSLVAIAEFFEVSVDYLVGRSDK